MQMKITGLYIVDLEYAQIQTSGELLRVVQFQPESETKWMRLYQGNQSAVACVGKKVTLDEDAQPYKLHLLAELAEIISFIDVVYFVFYYCKLNENPDRRMF